MRRFTIPGMLTAANFALLFHAYDNNNRFTGSLLPSFSLPPHMIYANFLLACQEKSAFALIKNIGYLAINFIPESRLKFAAAITLPIFTHYMEMVYGDSVNKKIYSEGSKGSSQNTWRNPIGKLSDLACKNLFSHVKSGNVIPITALTVCSHIAMVYLAKDVTCLPKSIRDDIASSAYSISNYVIAGAAIAFANLCVAWLGCGNDKGDAFGERPARG